MKKQRTDKISWMRRAWRPILAFTIILILLMYLVGGWFFIIFNPTLSMPSIPDGLWALASVFAGAYGAGRSLEQFGTNWHTKETKTPPDKDEQEYS